MIKDNLKNIIIPEKLKENIDEVLEEQLFNANRYYAESNPFISSLMEIEKRKNPIEFLEELKKRWNWHNTFYENLLEPAFLEITSESFLELTPQEVLDIIAIYKTCCLVDETTLVTSGAIKKHLEYNFPKVLIEDEYYSKEEARYMLLTPPVLTFFAEYEKEHLEYVILLKRNALQAKEFREYLKKKYHANDDKIFQSRFNKKYKDRINMDEEVLLEQISNLNISECYKINHLYFTIEHPIRKAFNDIIIYDNVNEKYISSRLYGISGFLFRRKVLEYLNLSNILPNNGYIYENSNEVVIKGLYKLYEERVRKMEKDIKPYRQRGDTCAIACMLMVLEYYKLIPEAHRHYESKYYRIYGSRYMDGTPFSALAWHFAKNGLDTEIYHSEETIFSNEKHLLDDNVFADLMEEYKEFLNRAKDMGCKVKNGIEVNSELIKKRLEEDKLVILAGQLGSILHAILICGYDKDDFIVCDPLYKEKQKWSKEDIESFMKTDIGNWCIAVTSLKQEKEKLLENLDEFQKVAEEKLDIVDKQSRKKVK